VYYEPDGNYYLCLQYNRATRPVSPEGVVAGQYWALMQTKYTALEWGANTPYAVGDQVQSSIDWEYYQCVTAHTSGDTWAENSANFVVLVPFNRYIAYEQKDITGAPLTPIAEFLHAWDADPRVTSKLVHFSFTLSADGAQFSTLRHSISFVWLEFRLRRPELAGEPWNANMSYSPGQAVYFVNGAGTGNFFLANDVTGAGESPATRADLWDVVAIPYFLRGYLIEGGFADWLTSDGQDAKAARHEGMAQHYLELEADKLYRQQGQGRRITWRR
jgi:hypothetical protein